MDDKLVAIPVPQDSSDGEPPAIRRNMGWGRAVTVARSTPQQTPHTQLPQRDFMKQLQILQTETEMKINNNQQELQHAIIQQEQRMQSLADQQTMNMQQVNNTVTEMQHRIGQLDTTLATLNATMTTQFQQTMQQLTRATAQAPVPPT